MPGALETVFFAAKEAAGFFMKNAKAVSGELFKVAALGLLLQIVFVLILVGIDVIGGGLSAAEAQTVGGSPLQMVLLAVAIVLFIIFTIGSVALTATNYGIVDEMTRGKRVAIIEKTRGLLVPIGHYSLALIAMLAVVFGVPAALELSGFTDILFAPVFFLMLLVVFAVVLFAIQFSFPEIVIGKRGILEAFWSSQKLAWGNVWTVITFDILLIVLLSGIALAFAVTREALSMVLALSLAEPLLTAAVLAASMVLTMLQNFLLSLVAVPLIYFFWKSISGGGEGAGAAKAVAQLPESPANPERGRRKRPKR